MLCVRCRGRDCGEDISCPSCEPLSPESRARWLRSLQRRRVRRARRRELAQERKAKAKSSASALSSLSEDEPPARPPPLPSPPNLFLQLSLLP